METVVLGGGPVGLTTALIAARYGQVVIILPQRTRTLPTLRIDCVPVALLALFVELGLHPSQLGASAVHDRRLVAWNSVTPEVVRSAGTVHILRPALENCLLERAREHRAIRFATSLGVIPPESRLLDATGRRAITADCRCRPENPAILRAIVLRGVFSRAQQAFRLASLPTGYAYRLGTRDRLMLGLVQGRQQWSENGGSLTDRVRRSGVEWLLAGIPCSGYEVGVAAWHRCNGPAVPDRQFGLVTQPSREMHWHRRASPTAFLPVCRYSKVSMQNNPIVREHALRSLAISQTFKD